MPNTTTTSPFSDNVARTIHQHEAREALRSAAMSAGIYGSGRSAAQPVTTSALSLSEMLGIHPGDRVRSRDHTTPQSPQASTPQRPQAPTPQSPQAPTPQSPQASTPQSPWFSTRAVEPQRPEGFAPQRSWDYPRAEEPQRREALVSFRGSPSLIAELEVIRDILNEFPSPADRTQSQQEELMYKLTEDIAYYQDDRNPRLTDNSNIWL
jgi:hypothetical protein